MITRRVIGTLAFGLFAGLLSVLWEYEGATRAALGALAGTCLMVSLRLFAADVREKS